MLALAKHKQMRPQRRLAGQIEALPRRVDDGFLERGLGDITLLQMHGGERRVDDLLPRHSRRLGENGAQAFVARDDVANRCLQGGLIERAR